MNMVEVVEKKYLAGHERSIPDFRPGDTVSVHVRIQEGAKSRVQVYEGVCIAMKEKMGLNGHFRVRKMSSGIGVERVFPFHSPNVVKIDVKEKGKSRRAKHFYLRTRTGKAARIAVDYTRS